MYNEFWKHSEGQTIFVTDIFILFLKAQLGIHENPFGKIRLMPLKI